MRRRLALAVLLFAAACAPTPRPVASHPPAPPPPIVAAPPPLAADWRDWPVTPGDWRYARRGAGGSEATFGSATAVMARLVCDPAQHRVTLVAAGGPGAPAMTVRTSTATRTLPTQAVGHMDAWPPVTHEAALPTADPLLDAMAFSRGRFAIERAGEAPLVLPSWAEVGRVIEDCR